MILWKGDRYIRKYKDVKAQMIEGNAHALKELLWKEAASVPFKELSRL